MKATSFHNHAFNVVIGFKDEYVPKWVYFAIHWVRLSLRKFHPDFASNNILHSLEYRPVYYNFAKGFSDKLFKKHPFTAVTKLTTKVVYDMLLKDDFVLPRIVSKFPGVDLVWLIKLYIVIL